jgi:alpha-mannosidase
VQTDGFIIETVKMAQSGEGIVIRGYEAYKERKIAKIKVGNAKKVFLCDLNENEMEELTLNGDSVEFTVKPFEIITLKIIY